MMEKSSHIYLTPSDLSEFREGRVSQRIQDTWGLTYGELLAIIEAHQYTSTEETSNGSC